MKKMSILAAVVAAMLVGACVNVDVGDVTGWGGGGESKPKEELQKYLKGNFDNVWNSTCAVARDTMKITERKRWEDDGESRGKIKGTAKDDVRYEIELQDKGGRGIQVKVKVKGATGVAANLIDRIRQGM